MDHPLNGAENEKSFPGALFLFQSKEPFLSSLKELI